MCANTNQEGPAAVARHGPQTPKEYTLQRACHDIRSGRRVFLANRDRFFGVQPKESRMSTVEQIELRAAEIRAAEARAMRNLAAHLREAVIDLPIESRLALAFVKRARTFEMAATAHDVVLHGDGELRMLAGDVRDDFGDEFPT
jgi:hypothetical protein